MPAFVNWDTILAFVTLFALEIILGVDNLIFLTISVNKLPPDKRPRARVVGLAGAMLMRILLLVTLAAIAGLTSTWITLFHQDLSGRDFILMIGGLFLIGKSTLEIHDQIEGPALDAETSRRSVSFIGTIVQIMLLDIVFSLDSVITAVGMTRQIPIMVAAIVAAVAMTLFFARSLSQFIENHATIRTLALAFLILIGMSLVAESLDVSIPKTYLYFAMGFSLVIELINLRLHPRHPVGNDKKPG